MPDVQRLVDSAPIIPSFCFSAANLICRNAADFRPFCRCFGYAINAQKMCCSLVVFLHRLGCPTAITGFIVSAGINSVDTQSIVVAIGKRPCPERFIAFTPFFAHPNAQSAIVLILGSGGVLGPSDNAVPNTVKPRLRIAMRQPVFLCNAAAGFYLPGK